MTNIIEFPKLYYTSSINLEIETTLLEDGSFWYRMKEIIGSKAGEWNEWVLLERSRE